MYHIKDLILSNDVTVSELKDSEAKMFIKKPFLNMQKDSACFEAIAILLKAKFNYKKIYIGFNEINWSGKFDNLLNEQTHYMRFLYRLLKFDEMADWVEICPDNRNMIDIFDKQFRKTTKINNVPNSDASHDDIKGQEHIIENYFVSNKHGQTYFEELIEDQAQYKMNFIYNQLPNGLFNKEACTNGKVCNKARIFPTGYYDIWGINEKNEFCIFELKKPEDNNKMGIISELYFYALFAENILLSSHLIKAEKNYRGYNSLVDAVNHGCNKVNACFLIENTKSGIHKDIYSNRERIVELLNSNTFNIHFQFIEYDYSAIEKYIKPEKKIVAI